MNHQGVFLNGIRQREYSTCDMLSMSGKLIPEFDGRRNIKDMFTRKPSLAKSPSTATSLADIEQEDSNTDDTVGSSIEQVPQAGSPRSIAATGQTAKEIVPHVAGKKRSSAATSTSRPLKRSKSGASGPVVPSNSKGQQSLKGFFFKPTVTAQVGSTTPSPTRDAEKQNGDSPKPVLEAAIEFNPSNTEPSTQNNTAKLFSSISPTSPFARQGPGSTGTRSAQTSPSKKEYEGGDLDKVHDPIQSKESWTKLFTKPAAPRCEGHNEPCKTMLTKKSGMNCGRSFWMCARPLGPSGQKEKNTQWRCPTFIWCSDWNSTTSMA